MNKTLDKNLYKNIKLDFLFRFLSSFAIVDGMFVLFLVQKGLPLWQIGILEGIFHATSIVTEIPSGALADLLGRKKVLMASRLCGIISSLIIVSSGSMWLLGIGFVFSAWTYNLLSGSEEALLYDSFVGLGQEEKYFKANSKLSFIQEIAQGLALLAGGYLAEISYVLCYVVMIVVDMAAFLVCFLMKETGGYERAVSVKNHFDTSCRLIKGSRRLQYVLFYYSVLFAFHTSVFLYSQEYYFARGFSESRIGLILLAVCGCTSMGALFSEKVSAKFGGRADHVIGAALAFGLMLMWSRNHSVSIIGFCINSMANAVLYPLQSNELNRLVDSGQRATIISVSSMCFSVVMLILFPAMGFATKYTDLSNVILCMGIGLFGYYFFHAILKKLWKLSIM